MLLFKSNLKLSVAYLKEKKVKIIYVFTMYYKYIKEYVNHSLMKEVN